MKNPCDQTPVSPPVLSIQQKGMEEPYKRDILVLSALQVFQQQDSPSSQVPDSREKISKHRYIPIHGGKQFEHPYAHCCDAKEEDSVRLSTLFLHEGREGLESRSECFR